MFPDKRIITFFTFFKYKYLPLTAWVDNCLYVVTIVNLIL